MLGARRPFVTGVACPGQRELRSDMRFDHDQTFDGREMRYSRVRDKAEVPRCLTPEQRRSLFLAPEPPRWCIDMHKWPYDGTTPAK